MIGFQNALSDFQGTLMERLGLIVIALCAVQRREVAKGSGHKGVIGL